MNYLILFSLFAGVSSYTYAQVPSSELEGVGQEILDSIERTQESFSINIESLSLAYPDYKSALDGANKKIQNQSKKFKTELLKSKEELEKAISKQISEYRAAERLAQSAPTNIAFQKILKAKKEEYDLAVQRAKGKFEGSYKRNVYNIINTFTLDDVSFDLKYKGIKKDSDKFYYQDETTISRFKHKYRSYRAKCYDHLNIYSSGSGLPDYCELTIGSYMKSRLGGYEFSAEAPRFSKDKTEILERHNSHAPIGDSNFSQCKTGACVYLLGEQVKEWLLEMKKVDWSISMKSSPADLTFNVPGITINSERIVLVIDKLTETNAKKLPLGQMINNSK